MVNALRELRRRAGFTVIELLVVLAAVALLLSVAAPRYVQHVDRAREAALRSNLAALRNALDQFHADKGRWPDELGELVQARYLRSLPLDPMTERADSWVLVAPPEGQGRVADVRSAAKGRARDGSTYASW